MTNSLTIHQHNLFQPARRRGNSPFRAPPLAAPENVSIERSAVVPIESRRAPGCAGPRPRGAAGGGEAARQRRAPPGNAHRRSASMLSQGAPLGGTLIGFHSLAAEERPKGSGCSGD